MTWNNKVWAGIGTVWLIGSLAGVAGISREIGKTEDARTPTVDRIVEIEDEARRTNGEELLSNTTLREHYLVLTKEYDTFMSDTEIRKEYERVTATTEESNQRKVGYFLVSMFCVPLAARSFVYGSRRKENRKQK